MNMDSGGDSGGEGREAVELRGRARGTGRWTGSSGMAHIAFRFYTSFHTAFFVLSTDIDMDHNFASDVDGANWKSVGH